ncbi:beta-1,6-N-acetylglucosaminyltransferase [Brachybacterium sp. UNK5269]|uniref:beta-1,6-N-acetylglucosaminyltransferase n=1 Tax=Brachybacterium sp. UNK5269 TaxID=3408576 RepID=UPI003BB2020E
MTTSDHDPAQPAAMRSAFAITTHADIPQLERLVHALTDAGDDVRVYISHDLAGEAGIERLASERCRIVREPGGRGDFSAIARFLSLFALIEEDGGADFSTVLSGADYPARPISEFLDGLDRSGDGFLHHHRALDATSSDWTQHEARQRYLYTWRPTRLLGPKASPRWHWLHGLNYLQPFLRFSIAYGPLRVGTWRGTLPEGMTCHGGSSWFSLSRRAVQHLLAVTRTRPDIVEWGRTSLAIDECYVQSVLCSAERFTFENHNGRFIEFSEEGFGHPRILTVDDADRIEESGAYFVRKIDSVDSAELLDRLDARRTRISQA